MSEKRTLTSEEEIEMLMKEKENLEFEIENRKKYEAFKESADDAALILRAFMDSGFTRPEAMELIKHYLNIAFNHR